MRTHLEFQSPRFEGGPNTYNPDIHGAKLAEFLDVHFKRAGYSGGIVEEDWGWMVNLASDPFPLWMGCAAYDSPDGWLVFIEPSKPYVRKWFSKLDAQPAVEEVAMQLEKIVVEHGEATALKWWSDHDSGRK